MKKVLIVIAVSLGVAVAGAVSVVVWNIATATKPYVIKPVAKSAAPTGVKVGHSIQNSPRMLSVVSSNQVIVVDNPNHFTCDDLWLVEKPRDDGSHALIEYRYQLPHYAMAEYIHPLGSEVPPDMQKVAEGDQWK